MFLPFPLLDFIKARSELRKDLKTMIFVSSTVVFQLIYALFLHRRIPVWFNEIKNSFPHTVSLERCC